jgi:Mrp family chromosome partitioning ATPase
MSRNFELLRRMGRAQTLFDSSVEFPQVVGEHLSSVTEALRGDKFEHTEAAARAKRVLHPETAAASTGLGVTGLARAELNKLVRRVFMFQNSHAPHVVSFSSIGGAGSAEICLQAGETLASQGCGTVCLVDTNLRSPKLHNLVGMDNSFGLTDAIREGGPIKAFATQIGDGSLWVIPAGPINPEGSSIPSDRMKTRLAELKEQFNFVLLDAPPADSHTDAALIGQMSEGLILVIEANSTRRETARITKGALEAAKVAILGAVLNNRTFPIPESIYHKL